MAGYLGNSVFTNVYLGSTPVDSLYLGADKFWPEDEDGYKAYFEGHQFTRSELQSAFAGLDIIGYNTGSNFTEVTSSTQVSWDGPLYDDFSNPLTKILDYDGMIQLSGLSGLGPLINNYGYLETASLHGLIETNNIFIASTGGSSATGEVLIDLPALPAFTNFESGWFIENSYNIKFNAPSATLIDDWFNGDPFFFGFVTQATLTEFDFPEVITVGEGVMYHPLPWSQLDSSFTTINLPKCQTIGQNAFRTSCPNVTTINVSSLVAPNGLGGAPTDDLVFQSVNLTGGEITIPVAFMSNNAGNPDGDLQKLIDQGWTTIFPDAFVIENQELTLEFISSSFGITGSTGFYDTSSGNTILELSGPYTVADSAFENSNGPTGIGSFIDGANGYCTELGFAAFKNCYPNFVSASFPEVTTIGEQAFFTNYNLASVHIPKLTSVPANAFNNCINLVGDVNFLEATSVGFRGFFNCRKIESINLPNVTSVSGEALYDTTALETINLPALVAPNGLGGSPGLNYVFSTSMPNSGSITLPADFATNNAGNPDADLQMLIDKGWTVNYV